MIDLDYIRRLTCVYEKNINRNYQKDTLIADQFTPHHIQIKEDLINDISLLPNVSRLVIIGASFGFNYLMNILNNPEITYTRCYDMDPFVKELAETFFKSYNNKIRFKTSDVWVNPESVKDGDLYVIPICEHLPPMKYWKGFKPNRYYILTSTDFDNIKDHNNCVNTLDEFVDQMPSELTIIDSIERTYEEYGKVFTIIGQT